MIAMIFDYIFTVIVKLLLLVFFIGLGALVIFLAYWGFADYATAMLKVTRVFTNDMAVLMYILLTVGCMFHTPSSKDTSSRKKFNANKYLDRVFFEHDSGVRMW